MNTEQEPVPKEFYDLVDRFIALANEITQNHNTSRVSAIILYAAARYNAHCFLAQDPAPRENRATGVEYFVAQYRAMLEENIDSLLRVSHEPPA